MLNYSFVLSVLGKSSMPSLRRNCSSPKLDQINSKQTEICSVISNVVFYYYRQRILDNIILSSAKLGSLLKPNLLNLTLC